MRKKSKPLKKKPVKKNSNKFITEKTLVGRYQLGWRMVNLYIDPNKKGGAQFSLISNKSDSFIIIGFESHYGNIFSNLVHESFEMVAQDMGLIFKNINLFEPDASDCITLIMNHNQYSEVASKAGYFIFQCQGDLKKAHSKVRT